jgi:hypothetical protein
MKDIGAANFILGMEIKREGKKKENLVKSEKIC